MRSNCHLRAWQEFVRGKAKWLAYRRTDYSRISHLATKWWWRMTLLPIGVGVQWAAAWLFALGWFLRWGDWYHMVWIAPDGKWWEYVPERRKVPRVVPPIIFKGKVQKVEDK